MENKKEFDVNKFKSFEEEVNNFKLENDIKDFKNFGTDFSFLLSKLLTDEELNQIQVIEIDGDEYDMEFL